MKNIEIGNRILLIPSRQSRAVKAVGIEAYFDQWNVHHSILYKIDIFNDPDKQ